MQFILVAIHDRAIAAFQQIITVRAQGEAVRSFQDAINDPKSGSMYQHPEDYDLYIIGHYDDQTGLLEALDKPQQLAIGKQLRIRT